MEKPTVKVGIVGSRSIADSEYVFSVLDFYLARLLEENEEDKILLFVTHRLDEIKDIVNRQVYMDLGKIVSDEIVKKV